MPTYVTIDRVRWRPHRCRFTSPLFSHDSPNAIKFLFYVTFLSFFFFLRPSFIPVDSDDRIASTCATVVVLQCNHGHRGK